MYFSRLKTIALAALALAVLPGTALAQQAGAPSPELQQQVEGWLDEMQQISGKLQELHTRAMQDPALQAAHNSLSEVIRNEMIAADPALEQAMQRLQELDTQAAAAQQQGNEARYRELAQEAMGIQQRFAAAQQQAVQRKPELVGQMEAFQTQVEAKMQELDPQAGSMIERMNRLQSQLAAVMQAQQQGGATPRP